jgi:hypothetical protein
VAHGCPCGLHLGCQRKGHNRWVRRLTGGGFRLVACAQGRFPTRFPCGRDAAVLGSDAAERSLRQGRLVPPPLEGLRVRVRHVPAGLVVFRHCSGIGSACDRGKGLEKGSTHGGSARVSGQVVADGDPIRLAQRVAHVTRGTRVREQPCVSTRPARDAPVPACGACARDPACRVASRLRLRVLEHRLDLVTRFPTDGGGVCLGHADGPRGDGQACLGGGRRGGRLANRRGATLHTRPRRGRMLERREDRGDGRCFPDQSPVHVAARERQRLRRKKPEDCARRVAWQNGGAAQVDAVLDFQIRIVLDPRECLGSASRHSPTGRGTANAPRGAVVRRPAVSRARRVCRALSEI